MAGVGIHSATQPIACSVTKKRALIKGVRRGGEKKKEGIFLGEGESKKNTFFFKEEEIKRCFAAISNFWREYFF